MIKIKQMFIFIAGCLLSAALGLSCWGLMDWMQAGTHPYITVVIVNMIGYLGHSVTAYLAWRCKAKI